MSKIFVGVAWPYASGPRHLGHIAGVYLPADIFRRYHRLAGNEILMVSGSDMHGTPTTVEADRLGVTPREVAMKNHELFLDTWKKLGIEFDCYTHTDTENHRKAAQAFFLDLMGKGHVFRKTMMSPYCPKCAKFLPDRYVRGTCPGCGFQEARGDQCDECSRILDPEELIDPRCSHCKSAFEMRETEHFFLRLSAFQDELQKWTASKEGLWRPNVVNFTRNFIANGLKDRAITRDLAWGVPVPVEGFEGKTLYVWFEAVMGYYSAAIEWARARGKPEDWERFWKDPECRHYYFLAKDNIPFHTIIWPAMLMGRGGLELPYDVPANEYLRWGTEKFSRSRGVGMTVHEFLEKFEVDPLRYYLSVQMPEIHDAEFVLDDFIARANNELVATLGNFAHRALSFTQKNFGAIPQPGELDAEDRAALQAIEDAADAVAESIERCQFKHGIKHVIDLARMGNKYFDTKAPWALLKADKAKCGTALYVSIRIVKALAVTLSPYLPHGSERIWQQLGYPVPMRVKWEDALKDVEPGKALPIPVPIFKKVEFMDEKKQESPFAPLDIRVAKVLDVQAHPNADKLMVLKIGLGDEERQIVAGLKKHYTFEEMTGKSIAVICNLEPAKLRGVESNGMLFAATDGDVVSLVLAPEGATPGTSLDGCMKGAPRISFQDFQKYQLEIKGTEGQHATLHLAMVAGTTTIPFFVNGKPFGVDRIVKPGSKVK